MSNHYINIVDVKPYTTKELAAIYNMSNKTFNRNIRAIRPHLGIRMGHFWNVKQVFIIFEHMGIPHRIIEQ